MRWLFVGVFIMSSMLQAQTQYVSRQDLITQRALPQGCGHLITWSKDALIYTGKKNLNLASASHRNFNHAPGSNFERSTAGHSALLLKYDNGDQDYISFFPKHGGGSIFSEEGKFTSFKHNMNYYYEKNVAVTSFKLYESAYNVCTADYKRKTNTFNGLTYNCTHSVLSFLQEELGIDLEDDFFSTPHGLKKRLEYFLKQNPHYLCDQNSMTSH
ncbi:hypothetical protein MRY82_02785 [bacterium]|nr:hypothetical protein [bacterium]